MVFKRFFNPIYLFYWLELTEGDAELALQSFKNRGLVFTGLKEPWNPNLRSNPFSPPALGSMFTSYE
ncbi:hypothetical protein [Thermococcus sp.]|uniref:hypothetical protein n=1 Tax=Thermococcus sp. TaxID=35749 RepID=UPI00261BB6AB|nr:hypothetical protein [Thermococcus sp.]